VLRPTCDWIRGLINCPSIELYDLARLLPAALAKYGEAESDARRGASTSSLMASPSSSRYRLEREKFFRIEFYASPLVVGGLHHHGRKHAWLDDEAGAGANKRERRLTMVAGLAAARRGA
jgi:hypothetical protein